MTQDYLPKLNPEFKTVSGRPLKIGTGTGTKWQILKKGRPEEERDLLSEDLVDQLLLALKNGFYHIDTAEIYTTHKEVGAAVKRSGIPREDLWITTKYNPGFGSSQAMSASPSASIETALKELETDYIDLFLVHSPFFSPETTHGYSHREVWDALVQAKKDGKVRHIGVSNHTAKHIEDIFGFVDPEFYPQVNQIEFHPYLQDQSKGIVEFCQKHDILVEAYSPLAPLSRVNKDGEAHIDNPLEKLLPGLTEKYNKTPSQILLRYTLQRGILPITTSSKEERIKESLSVYDFKLSDEDVEKINETGSFHFRAFFKEQFEGKN